MCLDLLKKIKNMTKDWLRAVFQEQKRLLKKHQVNYVHVPKYDELSVKRMWGDLQKDEKFNLFFPEAFPQDKGPNSAYFFK